MQPDYVRAFTSRGNAYYDSRDYDQAIQDFTASIRLNPGDPDPYFDRGLAYMRKRDYDNAIQDFKQILRHEPNSARAQSALDLATRLKAGNY